MINTIPEPNKTVDVVRECDVVLASMRIGIFIHIALAGDMDMGDITDRLALPRIDGGARLDSLRRALPSKCKHNH